MPYSLRGDVNGLSNLATEILRPRDVADRTAPVYGVCLHTTGRGVVEGGKKNKVSPLDFAVAYYARPNTPYFAHYVIGYDGHIVQIADEHEKALHVGFAPKQRAAFLDGSWEKKVPAKVVQLWKQRWPSFKSPAHLFPGPSPNNVYVGIELIPVVPDKGTVSYTTEQYDAAAKLSRDVMNRWGLTYQAGRVVFHEELNPFDRATKTGGWDPGTLRDTPWFDRNLFMAHI